MAQQAKKSAHRNATNPTVQTAEAIQAAEEKVLKMSRNSIEDAMSAVDSFNRAAKECAALCSDNASALAECSSKASSVLQGISGEAMEAINRAFSDYAEFAQEVSVCRSINDIVKLQSSLAQRRLNSYFEEGNKLCNILFDGCEQVLEPLNERTAITSEQLRKMVAV